MPIQDTDELQLDTELSKLHREAATEQPPAHLDNAILMHSRRLAEVAAGKRKRGAARNPFAARQWLLPTSLAAVIVLSVTLTTWMPTPEAPILELVLPPEAPRTSAQVPLLVPLHQNTDGVAAAESHSVHPDSSLVPANDQAAAPIEVEAGLLKATTRSTVEAAQNREPEGPISAQQWLNRIEALLEDGLQDEARLDFYVFREQYPNHPLPEGLLGRLRM